MIQYRLGNDDDLIAVYPSYAEEFPVSERKSIDQLAVLMHRGDYKLVIAEDVYMTHLNRLGFAMIYRPKDESFIWLDYLVMEKNFQGKGYGSLFFDYILQCFENVKGMYIEVEIPDGIDINQVRRINYYEKLGAVRLPMHYYLPTPKGKMPMYLYYCSTTNDVPEYGSTERSIEMSLSYIHFDHPCLSAVLDAISEI